MVSREYGFAAIAGLLLVGALVFAGIQPQATGSSGPAPINQQVPDEYAFQTPDKRGVATVGGTHYTSLQAAVNASEPGDTIHLAGRFNESVVVATPNLTLTSGPADLAVVDGQGQGDALRIDADDVTVRRVWVRNSGYSTAENDAGIWVNGSGVTVANSRVSAITFGIWVDGVSEVTIENNTIVGRESVYPISDRGNGIQLWKVERSRVRNNRITDVRDGIYYSWASEVVATENTLWDLRYGVHYMYSDDCRLQGNLAFDNDVGYALMVSEQLEIRDNIAVNNTGTSGHGILLKSVDETVVADNEIVGNERGLYLYNSLENRIERNLVLGNEAGVYLAAGSVEEYVVNNSFIRNGQPVIAVIEEQVAWNGSRTGNYWSSARSTDLDHDDIGEIRYRPAGLVEHLVYQHPQAAVFARSPAFDAIRLAESTVRVVDSPGVIDHHPLDRPHHDHWRRYYARD